MGNGKGGYGRDRPEGCRAAEWSVAGRRRRVWAGVGIAAAVLLAALVGYGCSGGSSDRGGVGHGDGDALFPRLPKVTGHIDLVEADPEQPRYFRRLAVTDADGRRWEFRASGWAGVSAAHLKDHQLQGATVTVWYERDEGGDSDGMPVARFVGD